MRTTADPAAGSIGGRRLVRRLTSASLQHWGWFLAGAVLVAAGGAVLASRLEIRPGFAELLPRDAPSARNARELARRAGGDGTVLVNVESVTGPEGLARAEAFATRLGEEYRALGPGVVRSVDYNLLQVERWYADHWPLFLDLQDLRKARDDLVAAIGEAEARANPLMNIAGEGAEPIRAGLSVSLLDPDLPSPRARIEERFSRYPDGFIAHPDRGSVTIVVRPTGTSLGIGESRQLLRRMQAIADSHRRELESAHLRVGFAGTFPTALAEYDSVVHDVRSTLGLVLGLVLLSLALFFRDARPVLALGAAIVVAVAFTFGVTFLAIGDLNTLTAFLGSIVVGNGINYGLVYLARVEQLRRSGVGLEQACHEGAQATAGATLLASAGTSVSFATLLAFSNRGFRHFGFIGGVGMLACWAATFALVPALLVLFERICPLRHRDAPRPRLRARRFVEVKAFAHPRAIVAFFALAAIVSVAAFFWRLPNAMEQDLNNLANDVRKSPELRRQSERAEAALATSMGGAVALLPSREAAERYCDGVRERLSKQPRLRDLIDGCQTLSSVVPEKQGEKLEIVREIRERITERLIRRLPPGEAQRARDLRDQFAAQAPLDENAAPPTLVDRFRDADGTLGRHAVVRDRPTAHLDRVPNLQEFAASVRDVPVGGERYDATGETVVVADLLAGVRREGPAMTSLAFVAMCTLVLAVFRPVSRGAVLLLSLAIGIALMAGVATLFGIKLNFFNFVVYPITFGIAIDYSANVLARVRLRRSVSAALLDVGPVVTLCSWTTLVGYGSLTLVVNRTLRSFGWYAIWGELAALGTALVFAPAMALVLERRDRSPGVSEVARRSWSTQRSVRTPT